MKKLIFFTLAILTGILGFSQGNYPVPYGQSMQEAADFRARVQDSGGTYYYNNIPYQIDRRTSYGLEPVFEFIPAASETSVVFSHIPTDGDGDFTFARTSGGNVVGESGYLQDIAANIARFDYLSGLPVSETHNAYEQLITYSEYFGNSYWAKSGSSVIGDSSTAGADLASGWDFTSGWNNAGVTVVDADTYTTTGNAGLYKTYLTAGKLYRIVITGTCSSTFGVWQSPNFTPRTLIEETTGGGAAINIDAYFVAETSNVSLYFRTESTGTTETTDITTFELYEVSGFSAPMVDSSGDVELTAYKLVEDGTTGTHYIERSLTVTSAATVTQSIRVKAGTRNWVRFEETQSAEGYYFDLTNGVVGTQIGTVDNYSISTLVDGFYTISITVTVPSTTAVFRLGLADADNSNSYTGNSSGYVTIYGANLSETDYAPPYASTSGSTATITADAQNSAGSASLFSGINTSGFLNVEIAAHSDDGTDRYISLSDGTTNNAVQIYYSTTSNQVVGRVVVGGVEQANMTYTLTDETDFSYVGVKWNTNDFALWVAAAEVATDNSGSTFSASTISEFALDDGAGTNDYYGKLRKAQVYTTLTDTQIANSQR